MRFNIPRKTCAVLASVTVASAVSACGVSDQDGATTSTTALKLSFIGPESHPLGTYGVQPFIEAVEKESDGTISIDSFPNGQVAGVGEQVDALSSDIIDMSLIVFPYASESFPLNQGWTLPFGNTSQEVSQAMWRTVHGDNQLAAEFKAANVVPLAVMASPTYDFSSTDTPLPDVESLDGLRLKTGSPILREIVEAAGADPVDINANELYQALDRGTVDGAYYYFGAWESYSLGELLHHATKNVDVAVGSTYAIVISTDEWSSLTEEQQTVMYEAGKTVTESVVEPYRESDDKIRERLVQEAGLKLYNWSPSEVEELLSRMSPVITRWSEGAGEPGAEAVETMRKSLDSVTAAEDESAPSYPDFDLP